MGGKGPGYVPGAELEPAPPRNSSHNSCSVALMKVFVPGPGPPKAPVSAVLAVVWAYREAAYQP